MPFESPDLVVRRVDAQTWAVVHPLVYRGDRDRFVVPAGFRTDFATVPRLVTWLVPRFGAFTLAAVLHDWLCTEGITSGVVTSRQADGLFRRVLRESGVPVLRRWLMWTGVRWGALADPVRRPGWPASAAGVLAISVLAAPLVVPPAVVILPGLLVYAAAEWVVGRCVPAGGRAAGGADAQHPARAAVPGRDAR
ncbi:DUF1353 domain-containing protein [Geodermatophilus sabuli]|uniref:DUF1353 domain-containing protein n=1 Tax=Geodermatophilus sabuli TaxID=1564158 RepID=A0A285E7T8_9ACTN|nr:DUF1353 domain-containing protein [Geodermatophilus sabuli]MBB3082204.1 hypothetical protein [Geodermatophilus sabuli]SNX94923.1 Protein of unknown function [Geodermatophilus sabuli]